MKKSSLYLVVICLILTLTGCLMTDPNPNKEKSIPVRKNYLLDGHRVYKLSNEGRYIHFDTECPKCQKLQKDSTKKWVRETVINYITSIPEDEMLEKFD
jgi:hypothetical protein